MLQAFLDIQAIGEAACVAAYACSAGADWPVVHDMLAAVLKGMREDVQHASDGWEVEREHDEQSHQSAKAPHTDNIEKVQQYEPGCHQSDMNQKNEHLSATFMTAELC